MFTYSTDMVGDRKRSSYRKQPVALSSERMLVKIEIKLPAG